MLTDLKFAFNTARFRASDLCKGTFCVVLCFAVIYQGCQDKKFWPGVPWENWLGCYEHFGWIEDGVYRDQIWCWCDEVCYHTCYHGYFLSSYRPQTKFAKVMFLHVSVSHSVHRGRGLAQYMEGYTPPPDQRQAPPPRSGTPHRRHPPGPDTPHAVHAGRYGQQAGGMHPTGMQSCYILILPCCWLVRGSLFIELGCPEDLGKGWRGDLGTFMISRPS